MDQVNTFRNDLFEMAQFNVNDGSSAHFQRWFTW